MKITKQAKQWVIKYITGKFNILQKCTKCVKTCKNDFSEIESKLCKMYLCVKLNFKYILSLKSENE